jgi:hypothetical protein
MAIAAFAALLLLGTLPDTHAHLLKRAMPLDFVMLRACNNFLFAFNLQNEVCTVISGLSSGIA